MGNVTPKRAPAIMMAVVNPIMRLLVNRGRGPSSSIMMLSWTGRKSGKSYSTPVSRFEIDDQLFTTTASGWSRNFVGGHPAEVVLDGKKVAVTGTVVDDPEAVGARMRRIVDEWGDGAKRAVAVEWETDPTAEDFVEHATANGVVVVDLTPSA